MKKKNNKVQYIYGLIALISVGIFILSGCGDKTKIVLTNGFQEGELFRIDDVCCFDKEAYVYLSNIENQYSSIFGEEIWQTSHNGVSLEDNVRNSVLGRLTKVKLMDMLASSKEIKLSSEEKSLAKKAAKEYYNGLNSETISKMAGIKENDVLNMYEDYALANKVYNQLTQDVNTEVSDDEARTVILKKMVFTYKFINEAGIETTLPEESRNEKMSEANQARNEFFEGADFDSLINNYSDGDNEEVYVKKGELPIEIENAIFMLATNEITEVLDDGNSFCIYYCVNPNDSTRTDGSKADIVKQRRKAIFDSIYDEFTKDKKCYLNQGVWDKIRIEDCKGAESNFFEIYDEYFVSTH